MKLPSFVLSTKQKLISFAYTMLRVGWIKWAAEVGFGIAVNQGRYRLSLEAAGTAFWLGLAVYPTAIAMVMIFSLIIPAQTLVADVHSVTAATPGSLAHAIATQTSAAAQTETGTLSLGLVISLVVLLWTVSSGGYALFRAAREAYGLPPQNYLVARTRAFLAALAFVIVLGISFVVLATLQGHISVPRGVLLPISMVVGGLLSIALLAGFIMIIYRLGLSQPTSLAKLWPGAVASAVIVFFLVVAVVFLGVEARTYQAMYGALASIAGTIVAIYMAMYVILLAAIFNAIYQDPPRLTEDYPWMKPVFAELYLPADQPNQSDDGGLPDSLVKIPRES